MSEQGHDESASLIRLLEKHAEHTQAYVSLLLSVIKEMQTTLKTND